MIVYMLAYESHLTLRARLEQLGQINERQASAWLTINPISVEKALKPLLRKSIAVDMHYGKRPHHEGERDMH